MANVESSGVAKAGLTTGIIGTSLAGLMAMNNNGSGGGLLNGLLGGNCNNAVQAIAERDAIIGQLTSEKYTDAAVLALRDKLEKLVDDAAAQTVKKKRELESSLFFIYLLLSYRLNFLFLLWFLCRYRIIQSKLS